MRTTINLDEDVLDRAKQVSAAFGRPFRQIINEALRAGLHAIATEQKSSKPYVTKARRMGLKPGRNLDNIQELLAQVESDDYR